MQWKQIENNWDVFKVIIQENWDEVSDQQLDMVAGKRARFSNVIQRIYGVDGPEAKQQLSDWQETQINIDGHFYTLAAT